MEGAITLQNNVVLKFYYVTKLRVNEIGTICTRRLGMSRRYDTNTAKSNTRNKFGLVKLMKIREDAKQISK